MRQVERLHTDEIKRLDKQVAQLLRAWRKMQKDYASLEAKYRSLQESYARQGQEHDSKINQQNSEWQNRYDHEIAQLQAERQAIVTDYKKQLHEQEIELKAKIEQLEEQLQEEMQTKAAMIARIRGVE